MCVCVHLGGCAPEEDTIGLVLPTQLWQRDGFDTRPDVVSFVPMIAFRGTVQFQQHYSVALAACLLVNFDKLFGRTF